MAGKNNITFRHRGKVLPDGSAALYDVEFYQEDFDRHKGEDIYIEIHLDEKDHTPEQMKYFRGPVTNIALQSEVFGGWTKQEFQEFMKEKFLEESKEVKQLDGTYKTTKHVPSLADLKIKAMRDFIENVIGFLAEHEIIVKSPNEYYGKEN